MFNGDRVSVLGIQGGDGCTTIGKCLMSLNWTLINGKMISLCYISFTTIKIN